MISQLENKSKGGGTLEEYFDLNNKIYGHQKVTALLFGLSLFVHCILIFVFRPAIVYYAKCLYYNEDLLIGQLFSFLVYFVIFVISWS